MEWNDVTTQQLRTLWTQGYSANEIGRRMGCTKNSIVGRVHRLDLEARPSPIRGRITQPKASPSIPRAQVTLPPLASYEPPPVITAVQPCVVAPPSPPEAVKFPPRSAGHCFFPLWRAGERPKFRDDGSALLCGDPIQLGSYCAVHAAACYLGRHWKSEEAAA